jgi:hypothetical protein
VVSKKTKGITQKNTLLNDKEQIECAFIKKPIDKYPNKKEK